MPENYVYPVGVLSDWQHHRWQGLRRSARYIRHQLQRRDWHAVRNTFNGYLAEHDGCAHNCGRGWTQRAASRRAQRLCGR